MKSALHVSLPNLLAPSMGFSLKSKSNNKECSSIGNSQCDLKTTGLTFTENRPAGNSSSYFIKRSDSITSFVKTKFREQKIYNEYPAYSEHQIEV